jgi:hypothetical protein
MPPRDRSRVPSRFVNTESRERNRDARERRDAVRKHGQRPYQLGRTRLYRRAVFGVDDVERVEQAANDGMRDADRDCGKEERKDDRRDRQVMTRHHHSR